MNNDKHVYKLDDGEYWYVVATSEEEALKFGADQYEIKPEYEDDDPVVVEKMPDDKVFTVRFDSCDIELAFDENGKPTQYPRWPVYRYFKYDGWVCVATYREWAEFSKVGELIASSVF